MGKGIKNYLPENYVDSTISHDVQPFVKLVFEERLYENMNEWADYYTQMLYMWELCVIVHDKLTFVKFVYQEKRYDNVNDWSDCDTQMLYMGELCYCRWKS